MDVAIQSVIYEAKGKSRSTYCRTTLKEKVFLYHNARIHDADQAHETAVTYLYILC